MDTNLYHGYISHAAASDALECQRQCQQEPRCHFGVFTGVNCFLRDESALRDRRSAPGLIVMPKYCDGSYQPGSLITWNLVQVSEAVCQFFQIAAPATAAVPR